MAILGKSLVQMARQFSTSAVRKSGWQQQGIAGSNLPFDISNRYKLTATFIVFFGSGIGAPFVLARHQLLKD